MSRPITDNPEISPNTWLQDDGATSHTVTQSVDAVTCVFPTRMGSFSAPRDSQICQHYLFPSHEFESMRRTRIRKASSEPTKHLNITLGTKLFHMLRCIKGNIKFHLEKYMA